MTTVAIVLIVSVFAFAVLGVPLAWSLGLSSLCAILTTGTISLVCWRKECIQAAQCMLSWQYSSLFLPAIS